MRKAKFEISGPLFRLALKNPDELILIQKDMAILKTEADALRDVVVFYATGPMFEEVAEGQIIPKYIAIINSDDEGNKSASFEKVGPYDIF